MLWMFALLNSPEFVFCYLAAHKVGAIACPVNYRQGAGEIALVIDDSCPKAFYTMRSLATFPPVALRMCQHKPDVTIMVDYKGGAQVPKGHILYQDYVANQPKTIPPSIFLRIFTMKPPGYIPPGQPAAPKGFRSTM